MVKTFIKISFLLVLFWTLVFSWWIKRVADFVVWFNSNVVAFLPPEMLFLVSLTWMAILFKLYQVVTR